MKQDGIKCFNFVEKSEQIKGGEDIDDGCGCKQPSKIKKDGLANITAEWSGLMNKIKLL